MANAGVSRRWIKVALVNAAYFILLVALAFLWKDSLVEPGTYSYTTAHLARFGYAGLGDPGSYAQAAMDIYSTGWIRPENGWIFNLWPPGFPLLLAALMVIFGPDMPIIVGLQVCAATLFSILLTLVYRFLRPALGPGLAFVVGLAPFVFPVTRAFLLQPTGVSLGETFGVGFFLTGMFLCLYGVRQPHPIPTALLAGTCLGVSAYIQARFEPFLMAFSVSGLVLVLLAWTRALNFFSRAKIRWQARMTIVFSIVTAQVVMLPWRLFHHARMGSLAWSAAASGEYVNSVRTTADLETHGARYFVQGGGNLVCRIDPRTCGNTAHAQEFFYRTLLGHPWEWINIKASLLGKYWFAPMESWAGVGQAPTTADLVFNSVIVAMACGTLLLPLMSRRLKRLPYWLVVTWCSWTLLATYCVIFTIFHYEVRYFFFGKVAYIFLFVLCVGLLWPQRGAARSGLQPTSPT